METKENTKIGNSTTEPQNNVQKNEDSCTYEPIRSFAELINYGDKHCVTTKLACLSKTIPLSTGFSDIKVKTNGERVQSTKCPKLIVCHDFKGGYGDDKFVNGTGNCKNYTFRHWLGTDIFIYFSHHFVTIPPLGWINAAHSHGIKILGTVITEWSEGEILCQQFLQDSTTIDKIVKKLCQITSDFGFDGFFVNIENKIEDVQKLIEFLTKLNQKLKEVNPGHVLLHYDSILMDGSLKWQNELNLLNKPFFDVCDGIFLNYNWNDEKLENSRRLVRTEKREFDVYVGVDVFGRGCYGGGGLNMTKAVEKIQEYGLSTAIFAPGWSYECHSEDKFEKMDSQLWERCSNNLYYKVWTGFQGQRFGIRTEKTQQQVQILFATDFSRGYGTRRYNLGLIEKTEPWFDLSKTSYQPILSHKYAECLLLEDEDAMDLKTTDEALPVVQNIDDLPNTTPEIEENKKKLVKPNENLIKSFSSTEFDTENGFFGGGCLKMIFNFENEPPPLHNYSVYIPLDIPVVKSRGTMIKEPEEFFRQTYIILTALKFPPENELVEISLDPYVQLGIEVEDINSIASTIHLSTKLCRSDEDEKKKYKTKTLNLKLSELIQNQNFENTETEDIIFNFEKNEPILCEYNGWKLICFLFSPNFEEIKSLNGIHIGTNIHGAGVETSESKILLGYLSLSTVTTRNN